MKKTKKAILISYDRCWIFDVQVVKIPCDFEYGIDDQYGDKIPFTIGSNQSLREYDWADLRSLRKRMRDDVRELEKGKPKFLDYV